MSIWTRISDALQALRQGESLSQVFAHLNTPPEQRVGFTIAVIALGAKMAKADGQVTRDEVAAFREVFTIAADDEANAARVFNLARQDVAGFDLYARRIQSMYGPGDHDALHDLLLGLFHIAMADGEYHPNEDAFLAEVAAIFGLSDAQFRRLRAGCVPEAERDPYAVLGVAPDADLEDIRRVWRAEIRKSHPDNLHARGLPEEAVALAHKHVAALNHAWDVIQKERA